LKNLEVRVCPWKISFNNTNAFFSALNVPVLWLLFNIDKEIEFLFQFFISLSKFIKFRRLIKFRLVDRIYKVYRFYLTLN
jgi:hypothetical protein